MKKRPFIIDCDTGTDDAIAIMAAFGSDEIELLGITSVNGNVLEEYVSQNNLELCEYLDFDCPVCRGATFPLTLGFRNSSDKTHGKTGLGSVELPKSEKKGFDPRQSARFIYEKAVECDGELELLVIGPMTNIAIAYIQFPEIKNLIKHIWFMGGSVYGGNVTTNAEFNIWADPEAAHAIFLSGIALTMVGLDVTLKAVLDETDIEKLRANHTKASDLTADLLEFMAVRRDDGGEDLVMHDALALAAAIYPECMEYEDYWMDVETNGTYTRGHTFADIRNKTGNKPNVTVAVKVDNEMFRRWLVDKINNYKN